MTGAAGFVGRALVPLLVDAGHEPVALVRSPERAAALAGRGIRTAMGDVRSADSLAAACEGADAVVHLAAVIREGGPRRADFRGVNVEGTVNLAAAARGAGVGRIVMASAIGASDDPSMRYMRSRREAERSLAEGGVPHCVLRFSVIFGERDEFTNVLAAMCRALPVVPVAGDGRAPLQPISVGDAARCLLAALESDSAPGRTYELGGPERIEYGELMRIAARAAGARAAMVGVPLPLMRAAVAAMEFALPRAPVTVEQLRMLEAGSACEEGSVEAAFGFEPESIREGLGHLSGIGFWRAVRISLGAAANPPDG